MEYSYTPESNNPSPADAQDAVIPGLRESDAAVLIVLGQSNAHGHGLQLKDEDRIIEPMTHVWGLCRSANQKLDLPDVTWSGYQSAGMNLGETQDHTVCIATEVAKKWQHEFENGNRLSLPDLYIIQISIGAQGLSPSKGEKNDMWNPHRAAKLIPGPLGTVDISLFPFTLSILKTAMNNLRSNKKNPVVIGVHWSAGNDGCLTADKCAELENLYQILFDGFFAAIGQPCTLYLEKLLCKNRLRDLGLPIEALTFENNLYREMVARDSRFRLISAEFSPYWIEETETNGVFVDDHVHYTAEMQQWFAGLYFDRVIRSLS